ncbi:unnamed protein product, partial [Iphiclides podalirius]
MSERAEGGRGVGDARPTHDTRNRVSARARYPRPRPLTPERPLPPLSAAIHPPPHIRLQCFKHSIALAAIKGSQETHII